MTVTATETMMRREIHEIPKAVSRLLAGGDDTIARIASAAERAGPKFAVTVARGSSDHACTFLKYAFELLLGLPVASVGPSVASIYKADLKLAGSLCVSVSQSGKSPDIVALAETAAKGGALTVAVTNDPASPLARTCGHVIDILAGPERSVAATKTFVNSAVSVLMLLAHWRRDDALLGALHALPDHLAQAARIDWPELRQVMREQNSIFVLGRGPGWAMANEAALKFKETCRIQAESYSAAEVLHGPVAIVGEGFPVLCLAAGDAAEASVAEVADSLAARGARAFVTSGIGVRARTLPHVRTGHPLTDPLSLIVSFYAMVERLAADRGIDPDRPRHLSKVTQTT